MQDFLAELLAKQKQQEILEEVRRIRLEREALKSRVHRPGLFERTMFNLANLMISKGKQLRRRYEIPKAKRNQPHSTHVLKCC